MPSGWTRGMPKPAEVALEDFEVVRLVDGHALSVEEAAERTGVSRSTAGRMLQRARRALANGIERRAPLYLDAGPDLVLSPREREGAGPLLPEPGEDGGCIAVASEDGNMGGAVARIFGRAPYFVVVDPGRESRVMENPGSRAGRWSARTAVKALRREGVRRTVAGRFGPEAVKALGEAGIEASVAGGLSVAGAVEFFQSVVK
jgi:predicted Fe-Mo cluster-binding NifX family protein/predicted DNA-binding protein (UPF0251 family)